MALQQTVKFSADVAQALADFAAYSKGLLSVNSAIKEVQATTVNFNAVGKATSIGFEGTLRNGEKLSGVAIATANGFRVAGAQIKDAAAQYKRLDDAARGYLLTMKDIARITEATFVKQTISSFNDALQDSVRNALKFQIAISEIRTISQENQLSFSTWSKELTKVSNQLGLPIADVAEANYEALSNQIVKGAESFEFLTRAGDLARTSQSTLTQSVNLLSSAFNAYQINASEAERVSAVFFKTVDLGRLRVSEIADTFGRVAFLGNTLGVSFEEVNAGLATLTIQGIKASDAQTLLVNIFQKLLRPTERMKDVFKTLGVANGQAAVQTYGFAGILQRLIDLAKQGDVDVGELFNEIRGRKGFEGLANFQGQFQRNLEKITDSVADYRRAVEIRAESPADFLIKEYNKLKNTLNTSFAQPLIEGAANAIKTFREVAPEIKGAEELALSSARAFVVYGVAVAGVALAFKGLRLAMVGLPFNLLTAGVVLYGQQLLKNRETTVEYGETLLRLQQQIKDANLSNITGDATAARFTEIKSRAEDTYKTIFQAVANARQGIDSNLDRIRDKTATLNDSLKNVFKSYFDQLNDSLQETERKISRTRSTIKSSKDAIQEFTSFTNDIIFKTKFEFATPFQQQQLLLQEVEKLKQGAIELVNKEETDPERAAQNAKQADENLKAAAQSLQEFHKIQTEVRKENAKAAGYTGPIIVNSLEQDARLNELKRVQVQLNEQIIKQETERAKRLEADKAKEADRLSQLRLAAKEFEEFNFQNKDGNVKPEFRDKLSGRLDPEAALGAMSRISDRLRGLIGEDGNAQINLLNLIETKKQMIFREAGLNRIQQETEFQRQSLENQKKFGEQRLGDARKQAQDAANSVFGAGGALDKLGQVDALNQFKGDAPTLAEKIRGKVLDVSEGKSGVTERQLALKNIIDGEEALDVKIKQFQKFIVQIRSNPDEFGGFGAVKAEDIAVLRKAVVDIQTAFTNLLEARRPGEGKRAMDAFLPAYNGGTNVPFGTVIADLEKSINEVEKGRLGVITGVGSQNAAAQQLNSLEKNPIVQGLRAAQKEVPALGAAVDAVAPKIQTQFNSINDAVKGTVGSMERLNAELQKMDLPKLQGAGKTSMLDTRDPFAPVYAASGGVIGLHPGGPRGTDTIPAWLSPRERVLSVSQNQQYERLATLLRPLAQPRYYSSGGTVQTNVGDIHISVPSSTPAASVQQMGQLLQRAVKRGRIKLS